MLKLILNILIAGIAGQLGLTDASEADLISQEPVVLGVAEAVGPVRVNEASQGLKISAKSAIVIDRESERVLFEKRPDLSLPIASISKLATALVFLKMEPDWEKVVFMESSDYLGGARLRVGVNEGLKLKDLFYASLLGSTNNAVAALVRSTGLTEREFMVEMNKKARELGMVDTYFAEPTGLNLVNHSTAADVSKLMKAALENEKIVEALKMQEYIFRTVNTGRWVKVVNTDKLLSSFLNNGDGYKVLGGKTGYILEAGYCLVAGIQGKEGQVIIAVILGAESNQARFQEAKGVAWWVFENWRWR